MVFPLSNVTHTHTRRFLRRQPAAKQEGVRIKEQLIIRFGTKEHDQEVGSV